MKKRILALILLTTTILCGCSLLEDDTIDIRDTYSMPDPYDASNGNEAIPNRFGIIEAHEDSFRSSWHVVYDKKTGVEYIIIQQYQGYSMCPLYNTDGTLMLYDEVL